MKPQTNHKTDYDFLEAQLNHFDLRVRQQALHALISLHPDDSRPGIFSSERVNLHAHSFFSYNPWGYSPSALAWQAWKRGVAYMGIVDFDSLAGVGEFLDACDFLGVKGVAGIETRIYIPEYHDKVLSSPGEPGIAYHMGVGFISGKIPQAVSSLLPSLRQQATDRNLQITQKLNNFLEPLHLDYALDILPMTPSGYATERHIIKKLVEKSTSEIDDPISFWHEKLGLAKNEVKTLMLDPRNFKKIIRRKLMKRGGIAYVHPNREDFPTMEKFHQVILAAQAIPCMVWLDGDSEGEKDIETLLDFMLDKGVRALNIIPDRNWHFQDPDEKRHKLDELARLVQAAQKVHLPILIGTELNAEGLRFVDDLSIPELRPYKDIFVDGAQFLYGHTCMARLAAMGFQSHWSHKHFGTHQERVAFYIEAGRLMPAAVIKSSFSQKISPQYSPEEILTMLYGIENPTRGSDYSSRQDPD